MMAAGERDHRVWHCEAADIEQADRPFSTVAARTT